ncbi:MAG: thioredoxin family protein [Candidatus Pacebacteria bacterium]|nr:thioredoxin family protein [Candidatus Paceibacterota bacterium]
MSTNKIVIAVIGVVVIAGGAYALVSSDPMMKEEGAAMVAQPKDTMQGADAASDAAMMKPSDAMEKSDTPMMDDKPEMMDDKSTMMKKGSYEAYVPEKLALAESGDVVLFFHAAWCPICVALEKDILAHQIPDSLTILKVDFDTAIELRKKYGVTLQHTFVQVKADGTLVKKWSDANTLADVAKRVQ